MRYVVCVLIVFLIVCVVIVDVIVCAIVCAIVCVVIVDVIVYVKVVSWRDASLYLYVYYILALSLIRRTLMYLLMYLNEHRPSQNIQECFIKVPIIVCFRFRGNLFQEMK